MSAGLITLFWKASAGLYSLLPSRRMCLADSAQMTRPGQDSNVACVSAMEYFFCGSKHEGPVRGPWENPDNPGRHRDRACVTHAGACRRRALTHQWLQYAHNKTSAMLISFTGGQSFGAGC